MRAMSRASARRPFSWLRRLLLLTLLLGLGGLGLLFWLGRERSGEIQPTPDEPELGSAQLASEGFEYTQTLEGRPVFRLKGGSLRSSSEGQVELTEVQLALFRPEGEYVVASERATYFVDRREASLSGSVRLSGGRELTLETSRLDLVELGRRLRTDEPVRFASGGFRGEASGLDADLGAGTAELVGPVTVDGTSRAGERIQVTAGRLLLAREANRVRGEAGVAATVPGAKLSAATLEFVLADDARTPQFLRLEGDVTGSSLEGTEQPTIATPFYFTARALSVHLDPAAGRPQRLEMEGSPERSAVLVSWPIPERARILTTRLLNLELADGRLAAAEAVGASEMKEVPASAQDQTLRSATARLTRLEWDSAGRLVNATLTGEVVLTEPQARAVGERAYLQPVEETIEIIGEPAVLTGPRGELRAPRLTLRQATQQVHATGPVSALLRDLRLPKAGTGGAPEEPVRVQAREADGDLSGRSFSFAGEVRAHQGDSLLFADQLRGEEQPRRTAASGHVRTLWRRTASAAARGEEPIEITAETLTYRESERRVLYEGQVEVVQGGRRVRAKALEVDLDDRQQARVLTARGNVELLDPEGGRTVTGDSAIYRLADKTVEIAGEPARLRDRQGNQLAGRRLLYDVASGTLRVGGAA